MSSNGISITYPGSLAAEYQQNHLRVPRFSFNSAGLNIPVPTFKTIKFHQYWIAEIGDLVVNANTDFGAALTSDANKNIYLLGGNFYNGSGNGQVLYVKYNFDGTVANQWTLTENTNSYAEGEGLVIDSSGNATISITGTNGGAYIAKLDKQANIIWQNQVSDPVEGTGFCFYDTTIDAGGNTYSIGWPDYGNSSYTPTIIALDSNGNVIWKIRFNIDTTDTFPGTGESSEGIIYSSLSFGNPPDIIASGNSLYVTFTLYNGNTGASYLYTAKLNSADGSISWQKIFGTDITNPSGVSYNPSTGSLSTTADLSGNVYNIAIFDSNTCIIKYDSNGNFIYGKQISDPTSSNAYYAYTSTTDSESNLYLTGEIYAGGYNPVWLIYKLDSHGNFVWQNKIGSDQNQMSQWYNFGHKDIQIVDNNTLSISGFCRQNTYSSGGTDSSNTNYGNLVAVTALIPSNGQVIDLGSNNWIMSNTSYTISSIPPSIFDQQVPALSAPSNPGSDGLLHFNGSNYLTFSPGITLGTGAFTVEGWFYPENLETIPNIEGGSNTNSLYWYIATNGVYVGKPASQQYFSVSLTDDTWYHIAIVRDSSGNENVFINGTGVGVQTDSNNYSDPSTDFGADGTGPPPNYYFQGYVSDFRVVGLNLYDPTASNITVPTEPLPIVVSQTKLLIDTTTKTTAFTDVSRIQTITNIGNVTWVPTVAPITLIKVQQTPVVVTPTSPFLGGASNYLISAPANFDTYLYISES
jgi:hypothetical protein